MIRELITSRELTYKILANLLFMRVLGNRELNYQEVKILQGGLAANYSEQSPEELTKEYGMYLMDGESIRTGFKPVFSFFLL